MRTSNSFNKEPSEEQKSIINSLENNNICVDSVVGGGKTSTVLFMCKKYTDLNFLLLTYNKRLK
jgi:superfamily II DNA or RNA helicase